MPILVHVGSCRIDLNTVVKRVRSQASRSIAFEYGQSIQQVVSGDNNAITVDSWRSVFSANYFQEITRTEEAVCLHRRKNRN